MTMMMENCTMEYHIPVLLNESLEGMNIHPDGIYVDVTFGGGGHSGEILRRLGAKGCLYGFDQDVDAEKNILKDNRFVFVRSNFRYLYNFMRYYNLVGKVDALLADLGVSSHHFDDKNRGFSFRFDGNLDMRMNTRAAQTAADILNNYSEEQLYNVFYWYGELKNAKKLATAVFLYRSKKKIQTIGNLLEIVSPFIGYDKEKKFLAKVFQSLRIEVNNEMDALRKMLEDSSRVLKPGGRLAIITYHSLEDRLVKNFLKTGKPEGKIEQDFFGNIKTPFKLVTNKVIVPSREEINRNPRSRSAKLRIAEKNKRTVYGKSKRKQDR